MMVMRERKLKSTALRKEQTQKMGKEDSSEDWMLAEEKKRRETELGGDVGSLYGGGRSPSGRLENCCGY